MAVLGIDIGTQSLKAIVLSDRLEPLGEGASPYQPSYPRPGWAEQHPDLWAAALRPAIAGALREAGLQASDIKGVGVASQLDGATPCRADGTALGPCIIWLDRRATREAEMADAAVILQRTGLVRDATHMAAKIAWLRAHDPAGRAARLFHQPVTWLVHQLTVRSVIDPALASTTMVFDLHRGAYAADLLGGFGLNESLLPPIAPATAIAGKVTRHGADLSGLAPGTPVVVGTGDDFASPLGGGLEPGMLGVTLGTAEVVGARHHTPVIDPGALVETHVFSGGGAYLYNPGWLCGGAVTWLLDLMSVGSPEELSALAAAAPPGADGLTFLPALSGAMAPEWIAGARGCFYGLTPAHGKAHMARSLFEGLAFAMRDVAERLASLGVPIDRIRLMGGGARSLLWPQIRADASGLPVEIVAIVDASPVGAAVLAAVGVGFSPDIATAARRAAGAVRRLEPDASLKPVYDRAYARYRLLFDALRPLYDA
jgi:xylulokinase